MSRGVPPLPVVSAIVATCDQRGLLPRALLSIAGQTHPLLEVVVVDDGSSDGTDLVVRELATRFPHPLRYLRQRRAGRAAARSRGLGAATGDFFAFLDAGDTWEPDAIEALLFELEDPEADFAYSPVIEVAPDGESWVRPPVAAGQPERLAAEYPARPELCDRAVLFRRRVLERSGMPDPERGEGACAEFLGRVALGCSARYCAVPSVRVPGRALPPAAPSAAARLLRLLQGLRQRLAALSRSR